MGCTNSKVERVSRSTRRSASAGASGRGRDSEGSGRSRRKARIDPKIDHRKEKSQPGDFESVSSGKKDEAPRVEDDVKFHSVSEAQGHGMSPGGFFAFKRQLDLDRELQLGFTISAQPQETKINRWIESTNTFQLTTFLAGPDLDRERRRRSHTPAARTQGS